MKIIKTTKAPAAIGPYSQATRVGDFLFVSGQIPVDPINNKISGNDIKSQTWQSLTNIKEILAQAGYKMQHITKCTVFLKDMKDFTNMNEVYAQFFQGNFPARCAIEVSKLPKDALVEIDAIAYKKRFF